MKNIYKIFLYLSFKSYAILAVTALLLILPIIGLIAQLAFNLDGLSYSYIWIALISIVNILMLTLLSINLVSKTKCNSIDIILYTKEFSRTSISFMKILYICTWTMITNILCSIVALICFASISNIDVGLSFFGAIIVAAIFLCLLVLPVLYIVSLKTNHATSISIQFSLCFLCLISFGSTIVFNANQNNSLLYEPTTQKYNYTQYMNLEENDGKLDYLSITKSPSQTTTFERNINSDFKININSLPAFNNFLFSQWLLTPASSIFQSTIKEINFKNISPINNSMLKLEQRKSYTSNTIIDENNVMNNVFLNVGDTDIFSLEHTNILEILQEKYHNIFGSIDVGTINSLMKKLSILESISDDSKNVSLLLNEVENILLMKILGVEKTFHELFYFNFYINNFREVKNQIYAELQTSTNTSFIQLVDNIWNNNTWINYFYFKESIADFDIIKNTYFIPMKIDMQRAPNIDDINFLKTQILDMNDDLTFLRYYDEDGVYQNITKNEFNQVFPGINTKQEWTNYVISKANTLQSLNLLYSQITYLSPNIFSMTFSPNTISTTAIVMIQELQYATLLDYSWVYIVAMLIGSLILWVIALKIQNRTIFTS